MFIDKGNIAMCGYYSKLNRKIFKDYFIKNATIYLKRKYDKVSTL